MYDLIAFDNYNMRDIMPDNNTEKNDYAHKQRDTNRNNLAHAQDIATHDWAAIARISSRIAEASFFRKG